MNKLNEIILNREDVMYSGIVSRQGLNGDPEWLLGDKQIESLFWKFHGKKIRVTIEVMG